MHESPFLAAALCALAVGAPGCSDESDGAGNRWTGEGPAAWRGMHPHFDLLDRIHLADVDDGGLVMDFGTPARHKYTSGGWKTSWDGDTEQAGLTFTYATSNTCRVYFPVDREGPITIRFRMRPHGSRTMSVYLNNEPIRAVRMREDAFEEHSVEVPADKVKVGENYLLLRFNGTEAVGRWQAAAAVDWIYVVPGGEQGARTAPTLYGELRGEMTVGGERRRVAAVRPGTKLSYYVEIPARAKLGFGVAVEGQGGPTDLEVVVTPEDGRAQKVFERRLGQARSRRGEAESAPRWQDEQVDLSGFAGKLVRLDLASRGEGGDRQRVGWSTPAVLVDSRPQEDSPAPPPAKNVIVLLVDALRADHLPMYAKTRVRTPAMERFVKEGATFERAQAQEPWTKPSVATLLSGLYPVSHATNTMDARLPESVSLLSEIFRDQGFRTASVMANGYVSDKFGFNQGWERYANFIRENRPTDAEHVIGAALDWIEGKKNERFFLYLHTIDPHVPYDPPEEFLRMYDARPYEGIVRPRETAALLERIKQRRAELDQRDKERLEALYDAEISYHDRYFAVLLDKLREWGILDETVVVVTADHGEEFFDHGSVGHGHSLYQELLHVPLAVRYPAAVPAGVRVGRPVGVVDIAPTLLELTGIAVPDDMEGLSLMGSVRGVPSACPEAAFSYFQDDRRALRTNRWKMVYRGASTDLFDLQEDPRERTDVDGQHPIALRYTRVLMGQFLGATSRRDWCAPAAPDEAPTQRHEAQQVEIDPETREQLKALGYAGGP